MSDENNTPRTPRGPRLPRSAWLAVAVGALWRVGVLVVDKWHRALLLNDSFYYSGQASQLARGVWFRELFVDQPGAEHGPLTAVIMAPVSWMGHAVPWQRTVTVACGIATIVVVAMLARDLAGRRACIIAAWIAALYPNLWMNDGLVMSESASTLFIALLLWRLLRVRPTASWRAVVAIGAVAGLAALARSELIVLVGLSAVWLWATDRATSDDPTAEGRTVSRSLRRPALFVVGAGVVVLPWVAFNLSRFERPVYLTTNDGTTLMGTYCADAFYGPGTGTWSLNCITADPEYRADEEPSVRSARQRTLALTYASDHLRRLPVVVAARVGGTLDLYGLSNAVHQDVGEERYRWASWAGIGCWWIMAPLAVVGLLRIRRSPRWLLLLPVIGVAFTTVVFYGGHRIRSPLEVTVVVAVAVVLARIGGREEVAE